MVENQSDNPIVDMLASSNQSVPEEVGSIQEQNQASLDDGLQEEPAQEQEVTTQEAEVEPAAEEETTVETPTEATAGESEAEGEAEGEAGEPEGGNWYDDDAEGEASGESESKTIEGGISSEALKGISEALGIESFGDEELVLGEIASIKSQRDELQQRVEQIEAETPYANEHLEKANDLAKNGGDWQQYLGISSIDYNNVPDESMLVEAWLRPSLGDDNEKIAEHLNGMTDSEKKLKAGEIRASIINDQEKQLQSIRQEAMERKRKVDEGLKKQLGETKEMFGVKVTAKDRKEMFDSLTSDNGFINETFFNKDGSMNFKSMSELAFMHKNIGKIVKLNVQNAKTQGKKQVIEEATNTNLNKSNGGFNAPKDKVKKSGFENYFSDLMSGKNGY
jgi:hypothetical protein